MISNMMFIPVMERYGSRLLCHFGIRHYPASVTFTCLETASASAAANVVHARSQAEVDACVSILWRNSKSEDTDLQALSPPVTIATFEPWTFHTLQPNEFTAQNTFVFRRSDNASGSVLGFIVLDKCTMHPEMLIRYLYATQPAIALALFAYAWTQCREQCCDGMYLVVPESIVTMLDEAAVTLSPQSDSELITLADDVYRGALNYFTQESFRAREDVVAELERMNDEECEMQPLPIARL
eukprot:TRINITY_DN10151_c0_g1_i1.p1 TRINITY_DN10151_c0_g1~~TRINITY_DN10151_c0_g1_i1.p1  ORF type:complete len:240 (+),score=53.08 TRINITY_DN10151_c0_g1_i1:310-1029(+)